MKIIKQIVNARLNKATAEELLSYAEQYGYSITYEQADKVAAYLRGRKIDIFDDGDRVRLVREISRITDPALARELNSLFLQFLKEA